MGTQEAEGTAEVYVAVRDVGTRQVAGKSGLAGTGWSLEQEA